VNQDDAPRGRQPLIQREGKPTLPSHVFFWCAVILAVLLSVGSLYRRLEVEWSHRVLAIIVDYKDVVSLSGQSGDTRESVFERLWERGVRGITVSEFTGKDLASGAMQLTFSPLAAIEHSQRASLNLPLNLGTLRLDSSDPMLPAIMEYLRNRMPGVVKHVPGKSTLIVLPVTFEDLNDAGILPDFAALDFAKKNGSFAVYRPAFAPYADARRIALSVEWLKKNYSSIVTILPAGNMVVGYPRLAPIAETFKKLGLTVAQAEFVRQIGSSSLFAMMNPDIIPLHSLVRDEVISRRLSRGQIVERMVRAVHERSIRLLLMRPYDLYSTEKLTYFLEDLGNIHAGLRSRGYAFAWPRAIPRFGASFFAAMATSLLFVATFRSYAKRYAGNGKRNISKIECALLCGLVFVLGLAVWRVSPVTKLLGGLTAALVATEATLWALDRYTKPFDGLIAGLLIVLGGGLVIAAFYGTSSAMLRLTPFSGVKLTLLLPPLLVLINDLKQRIHPEALSDILLRPPLWGEMMLLGVLAAAALVLTVRSGYFGFVPGWEVKFRDLLEKILWVRPRTKEFLVGYPCLIIYYSLVRGGVAAHYREVFRVGASLAYASAINTFCHFHTLLPLTVVRVVNGWWLGILSGFVILVVIDYVGGPIWRRGGKELFH
jgi:hypothetical protein